MIYMDIVKNYLNLIESDVKYYNVSVSRTRVLELLRYTLCSAFHLESSISILDIEHLVPDCIKNTLKDIPYHTWSREYCQGVLEGCMIVLNTAITKSLESRNERRAV